jgi:hypothetical protein
MLTKSSKKNNAQQVYSCILINKSFGLSLHYSQTYYKYTYANTFILNPFIMMTTDLYLTDKQYYYIRRKSDKQIDTSLSKQTY